MISKRSAPAQKAVFVLELQKQEETLPQIASQHSIHPNLLRKWKT
jgi:transposase